MASRIAFALLAASLLASATSAFAQTDRPGQAMGYVAPSSQDSVNEEIRLDRAKGDIW